jgi:hypothetical protein
MEIWIVLMSKLLKVSPERVHFTVLILSHVEIQAWGPLPEAQSWHNPEVSASKTEN